MAVSRAQLKLFKPYLAGERPNEKGEVDMHCPLHRDTRRSAQLNVRDGLWYCHAKCGGGTVDDLVDLHDQWEPPPKGAARSNGAAKPRGEVDQVTQDEMDEYCEDLLSQAPPEDPQLGYMEEERGIWAATLKRYGIGYDFGRKAFTIPVYGRKGLLGARFYKPFPGEDRRKIWQTVGLPVVLYPYATIEADPDAYIICEGELDAVITNQFGFPALTRTASAKTWKRSWNRLFKGKLVYLCHDMDETGQAANERIAAELTGVAREVRIIRLPYPVVEKGGKDLTDFFRDHPKDGKTVLRRLMEQSRVVDVVEVEEETGPPYVPVDDIVQSKNFEKKMTTEVTVRGVQDDNWWAPRKLRFVCSRDAGPKCDDCPMMRRGKMDETIESTDRRILRVVGREEKTVLKDFYNDFAREYVPGGKCTKLRLLEVREHQPVSKLIAQQLVDTGLDRYHPDNNLKITAAGDFAGFPTNVTARLVGLPTSDPNSNRSEFLVESMEEIAISTDRFEPDAETIEAMRIFQPSPGQDPGAKLLEIAEDMEAVSGIHGRVIMHAAMDLAFHSVLSFDFRRQRQKRGWIELLVTGDTRTGKSETAQRLVEHYGAGVVVSCESATMAGIKGAVTKMGKGDDKWYISWGALPLNDRRLVVLDEVKGLTVEEIADLSDVRSSGVITLTKARTETALARTRAIWLSNPRDGDSVNTYYGIDCVQPLIGASEDVARFDLAVVVRDDVPMSEINRLIDGRPSYEADTCNSLIRWVWSRSPEQVIWEDGAEEYVVECATKLITDYVEDPPLIRRGDQRIKLARLAVALAARLFSADETYERILVTRRHVRDAARFVNNLYSLPEIGYREKSQRAIDRVRKARDAIPETVGFMKETIRQSGPQLIDYLRGRDEFWARDLQEYLGMDIESANYFISQLAARGMIKRGQRGANRLTPTLQTILKEVRI